MQDRIFLVMVLNDIIEELEDVKIRVERLELKCQGMKANGTQQKVADLISRHFSSEEIDWLAFQLDLNGDYVEADSRGGKARELVLACDRRGLLSDLLAVCKVKRPGASWPLV